MQLKIKIEREIECEGCADDWSIGDSIDSVIHEASADGETVVCLAIELTADDVSSNNQIIKRRIERGGR